MPGTVNGWTIAYTAAGGVLLMSGITGTSLSATVKDVLAGNAPAQAPPPAATAGGTTAVAAPASASESSWAQSLLSALGAPATAANISSIETWIAKEGDFSVTGHNNPLNTTLVTGGSTGSFNSSGVQDYGTSAEGLAATVQTLESGAYADILLLLRSGQGLASGAAQGLSTWSGGAYGSV
jgi:hypothetical protein